MKLVPNWLKKFDVYDLIGFTAGTIIGITLAVWLFCSADKTPATIEDYLPMYEQVLAIEQTKELPLENDIAITVNDGIISTTLQNNGCQLIAKFNQDFELLSLSNKDIYYIPWFGCLVLSILIGLVVGAFSTFFFWLIVFLFGCLIKKIKSKTAKENID